MRHWHGADKGRPPSVLNAIDIKLHSRFRRAMHPAFTEKAVRMHEPIIQSHVRLFISMLDKLASSDSRGGIVKILRWVSFVVFGGIENLGFGEPFGCLESSEHHPWCSMIFTFLKAATYRVSLRYYPALNWLMSFAIPKSVVKKGMGNWQMSADKINRRLKLEKVRPDIICMINGDETGVDGLTDPEMLATSSVLIIAGSDGTISVLTARSTIWSEVRTR